jgi:hypothetical protein
MPAKPKTPKTNKAVPTVAFHKAEADGVHHTVGIGNLRVAIVPDGKYWVAQCLEIDYAAQGDSVADAKLQFKDGLAATVQQHLRIFGNIQGLLVPAPPEVWKDAMTSKCLRRRFSQISQHRVFQESFPFQGIDYLEFAVA